MTHTKRSQSSHWLLDDAVTLYHLGRKHSAILLLLCAVDALAREAAPTNTNSADRFENFLRSKMRRSGRAQIHTIEIARLGRSFSFEYIIYKFLRCPLVHEGARLEANDPTEFIVCLDWDTIPHGIKLEPDLNRVLLGGELVFDILADSVQHELENGSGLA
ncbi:MAG: hypothetical protein ABSF80_07870 [Chitinispirillaceae bacterium]|jgi:hypothetical protein